MKNKITPWDILNYSLQNIFFKGIEVDIAGVQKSEETIANFQWFLRRPSPLNVFWAVWPLPSMVLRWFFDVATIAFNGFRWFRTIGQTMRWFRWIVVVYGSPWQKWIYTSMRPYPIPISISPSFSAIQWSRQRSPPLQQDLRALSLLLCATA